MPRVEIVLILLVVVSILAWRFLPGWFTPPSPAPAAEVLEGEPSRIADGDTFTLLGRRVRLQGIDAPEMDTPDGPLARDHMTTLIGSGPVSCTDTGQRSYDRVVAVCHAGGRELGAAMVEDGWAVEIRRFSGGRYAELEGAAADAARGMHATPD